MSLVSRARAIAPVRDVYRRAFRFARRALLRMGYPHLLGPEAVDMRRVTARARLPDPGPDAKRRILFVVPRYWRTHAVFQVALAQSLTLRGARCAIVTCGGALPVCEIGRPEKETVPPCGNCRGYVEGLTHLAGIRSFAVADHTDGAAAREVGRALEGLDLDAMARFEWRDLPLGRFAIAPTRWRLRAHRLDRHPQGHDTLHAFVRGGAAWADGFGRVLTEFDPDTVVMLNGMFLEERVSWALCHAQDRRVVFFERGREAGTAFLSHNVPAPRHDMTAGWERARDEPLDPAARAHIRRILDRRAQGDKMVEQYWASTDRDRARITERLGLCPDSPLAVLFTNVIWDTAMQERDVAFADMFEWVAAAVELFRARPNWTLVIRVHPAETQVEGRESYERVTEWIAEEWPELPDNIRVVAPHEPLDSYALMAMARVGLVYGSTTGLELAAAGVPVVVAGNAHYARKGFTADLESTEDFGPLLERLMGGERLIPLERQVELAERYAYLFFSRRTLPMAVVEEARYGYPRLAYHSIDDLRPGRSEHLDTVCDGILHGTEFAVRDVSLLLRSTPP